MTVYRNTKQLTEPEAAYIAGLIDGEGTVALSRKHAGDNRQLCISISNTERALLDYVLDVTGLILRDYVRLTPRNGKYTETLRHERSIFEAEVQNTQPE